MIHDFIQFFVLVCMAELAIILTILLVIVLMLIFSKKKNK